MQTSRTMQAGTSSQITSLNKGTILNVIAALGTNNDVLGDSNYHSMNQFPFNRETSTSRTAQKAWSLRSTLKHSSIAQSKHLKSKMILNLCTLLVREKICSSAKMNIHCE
jgi:hypothetical protein